MHEPSTSPPVSGHAAAHPVVARRVWAAALLVSLTAVAVAVVWRVAPDTYPYGSGDIVTAGINHLLERGPAVLVLLTAGAVGILLAGVVLWGGASRTVLRIAGAGAAVEAAFFAFVMSDGSVMSTLGYAVALAVPAGVVALLVLAGRRWRPAGLVLALLAVLGVAAGVLTGAFEVVTTYLGNLSGGLGIYGSRIAWSWGFAAAAGCWAWAALGSLPCPTSSSRPAEAATPPRWGRAVTIAAALCPVPYGLARLTWLTPWPLGGPGPDAFVMPAGMDAATRLQGFLFAPAVAVGVVLTLGLISRWGEVFPRWVPGLGGRAVPVPLAVIPGAAVAAVVTISAPGILVGPIVAGDLAEFLYMLFFMPFPVWGPLLSAAVFAYWLRRTGGVATPAAPRPRPS